MIHYDTEPEIADAEVINAKWRTDIGIGTSCIQRHFANTLFLCRTAGTRETSIATGIIIILIAIVAVFFLIFYPIATGNTCTFLRRAILYCSTDFLVWTLRIRRTHSILV